MARIKDTLGNWATLAGYGDLIQLPSHTAVFNALGGFDGFGVQFAEIKDIDRDNDVAAAFIGFGDAADQYWGPVLKHRGTKMYIKDPKYPPDEPTSLETLGQLGYDPDRIVLVASYDEIPQDVAYIANLTPPSYHLVVMNDILISHPKTPVLCEKPLVTTPNQLAQMEALIENMNAPFYAVDWAIHHGLPLLKAATAKQKQPLPFSDSLEITGDASALKKFDLARVTNIEARFIDGADPDYINSRPFLRSAPLMGGGMLTDMAPHIIILLEIMGFKHEDIQDVILGDLTDEVGVYNILDDQPDRVQHKRTGEIYARANTTLSFNNKADHVNFLMEVGKHGHTDGVIILETDDGLKLTLDLFPNDGETPIPGSIAILTDKSGNELTRVKGMGEPYSLSVHEAMGLPSDSISYYAKEGIEALRTLFEMNAHGRRSRAEDAPKVVQQLVLERGEKPKDSHREFKRKEVTGPT